MVPIIDVSERIKLTMTVRAELDQIRGKIRVKELVSRYEKRIIDEMAVLKKNETPISTSKKPIAKEFDKNLALETLIAFSKNLIGKP